MGQDQFAKKPGIKNAIYKREIFFFFTRWRKWLDSQGR